MKSTRTEQKAPAIAATSASTEPTAQRQSDFALIVKVVLIAGSFFAALWLLEKIA